jgi:hypothetical protein
MEIKSISDFRKAYRNGPFAWPGGYPLFFITSDGVALSWKAAKYNRRYILQSIAHHSDRTWRIVGVDVNWENPALYCDDTGERIPSAHAEDEAESTVR